MLKPAVDFGKQALSLMRDVQQCKADIKELQQNVHELQRELKELTAVVQQIIFQMQRNADNERHEREKMALRFEIMVLRLQQGLPPADPPDNTPAS